MRITINSTEGAAAVISKVLEAPDKEITLYLPKDSSFFADIENLKLLKKQTELLDKTVTIVSPDDNGRRKAQEAGFRAVKPQEDDSFFASLEQALSREMPKATAVPSKADTEDAQPVSGKKRKRRGLGAVNVFQGIAKGGLWKGLIVAVLGVLVWIIFFLPFAEIKVTASKQLIEISLSAVIDENLTRPDIDAKKLPAQIIEAEKEISLVSESTGFKDFNQKAQGTITVYNKQTFEQPMIPSRFQAGNGNIYWSQRNILIPPAYTEGGKLVPGSLKIQIVADRPGEEYNLKCSPEEPCQFTVPAWKGTSRFEKVYGQGTTPLLGGEVGESKVVTESDLKVASQIIRSKAEQESSEVLASSMPEGFELIEGSITFQVNDIVSDKAAGEMGDRFTTKAKLTTRAFIISKEVLREFVDKLVQGRIEAEKIAYPDSIEVSFVVQEVDFDKGTVQVSLAASEKVGWKIEELALKQSLAGKSLSEARKILLGMDNIDSAEVRIGPKGAFWVSKIPGRLSKIHLEVD
jgi:hypothetical protein